MVSFGMVLSKRGRYFPMDRVEMVVELLLVDELGRAYISRGRGRAGSWV